MTEHVYNSLTDGW